MAYILDDADDDLIHSTTHGIIDRDDLNFLRDRVDNAFRTAGGFASRYLESARESLARFDLGRLRDRVDSLRGRFGRRDDEDRIRELITIEDFQNAKPTMRRYLMAETRLRTLVLRGRADGWSGLYSNHDGDVVGRDHGDWREVMNGAHDESVVDEDRWTTYPDRLDEYGETILTHVGRQAVRFSWRELRARLDEGKQDPSSHLRKTL